MGEKQDINISLVNDDKEVKVKTLKLQGVLDTVTVQKLDSFMSDFSGEEGVCLILDCRGLAYLNSTGLSSLILYHIQAKKRKGAFKLCGVGEDIKKTMNISGADKLLEVFKTEEAAIGDWQKGAV